jgi:hypothetical protein
MAVSNHSHEPQEGDASKRCQPQSKRKSFRVFDELALGLDPGIGVLHKRSGSSNSATAVAY